MILSLMLFACGGGLSNEQRKALKDEMESRAIKKVQDEDIVSKTFDLGAQILNAHKQGTDSLLKTLNAKIYILKKVVKSTRPVDTQLLEAYTYGFENNDTLDHNVQRDGEEMVFTSPLIVNDKLNGIYVIRIPRKQVVLSL